MELTELLNSVNVIQVLGEIQRQDVGSIEYDSRKVKKNSVFVAIKGFSADGHNFVMDAINKGAIAAVIENDKAVPDEIFIHNKAAKILVNNSRIALSELSKGFYKDPSSSLKNIAITGTNGKTTTAFYLKHILENTGNKSGLIGTIANYIGDVKMESKLTTPESKDLNSLLYEMISQGCTHNVMEVSSHSLVLNRVDGLDFRCGIFTNITSEHLDFHSTFENYLNAKKILFDNLSENSFAIINADDPNSNTLTKSTKAKKITYGVSDSADYKIYNIQYDLSGTKFNISCQSKDYSVSTSLIGTFNAYNATAAMASAHSLGIDAEKIAAVIKSAPQVPGRFEVIGSGSKKIIVDYSHTADSLKQALLAVREIVKNNMKVITIFGCGGNRDKTKRPEMGRIASELSDDIIITSDNPRTEDPFQIINDIKAGIVKSNFKVIENREEAIALTVKSAPENSVILIAGKGHEDYQEINGVRNHFSDQETARKYLNE
ncbi:MAG TPA: UDP-N-acetylmuramoyl-L-alanyl-D-glutamate--2,6-diaminopimelate ligase [Ignavibacteriaceae bacterium]|nr:UDP-N-acetylmuramoyl-L-alanyl-D-glutamate--2,6-diaminopimelate ligase [Ignavibacteriaceae bacterium]